MISDLIKQLKPSATLSLATKAKEMAASGKNVISLTVGEPDWETYEPIKEAAIRYIKQGKTKYVPSSGVPELREAVAKKNNQQLQTNYAAENVTVSSGGKFLIYSLMQSVLNPGDEVIIPAPYWVSYPSQTNLVGAKPVIINSDSSTQFKLDAKSLEESITSKTKMLILNSPSNPTGRVYSRNELLEISKVLKKYPKIIIMSDDIYNELVFSEKVAPHILQVCPELIDRTVIVSGASKAYSMTGWRLGWAVGPKPIVAAMTKFHSQTTSCAASFTQYAVAECMSELGGYIEGSVKKLKKRMSNALEYVESMPLMSAEHSEGAFYIWLDIRECLGKSFKGKEIKTSDDFSQYLLEETNVVVVPGSAFGLDGYLRASIAVSDEKLKEAMSRFKNFLEQIS